MAGSLTWQAGTPVGWVSGFTYLAGRHPGWVGEWLYLLGWQAPRLGGWVAFTYLAGRHPGWLGGQGVKGSTPVKRIGLYESMVVLHCITRISWSDNPGKILYKRTKDQTGTLAAIRP